MDIGIGYAIFAQLLSPSLISETIEGAATMPEENETREDGRRMTREEVKTMEAKKQRSFYGLFSDN